MKDLLPSGSAVAYFNAVFKISLTNISLASWDLSNIGGDLIALCGNAFVCTTLLVLIETGSFMWLVRRCSKEQLKDESSDIESFKEFE